MFLSYRNHILLITVMMIIRDDDYYEQMETGIVIRVKKKIYIICLPYTLSLRPAAIAYAGRGCAKVAENYKDFSDS